MGGFIRFGHHLIPPQPEKNVTPTTLHLFFPGHLPPNFEPPGGILKGRGNTFKWQQTSHAEKI